MPKKGNGHINGADLGGPKKLTPEFSEFPLGKASVLRLLNGLVHPVPRRFLLSDLLGHLMYVLWVVP